MNTTSISRPLRLHRSWLSRWLADRREAFGLWRRHRAERARIRRELEAAGELSDAVLRDMGAPEWLVLDAQARREAHAFERERLGVYDPTGPLHHS